MFFTKTTKAKHWSRHPKLTARTCSASTRSHASTPLMTRSTPRTEECCQQRAGPADTIEIMEARVRHGIYRLVRMVVERVQLCGRWIPIRFKNWALITPQPTHGHPIHARVENCIVATFEAQFFSRFKLPVSQPQNVQRPFLFKKPSRGYDRSRSQALRTQWLAALLTSIKVRQWSCRFQCNEQTPSNPAPFVKFTLRAATLRSGMIIPNWSDDIIVTRKMLRAGLVALGGQSA